MRWAEFLRQQSRRAALPAEGEQGKIQLSNPERPFDGILLEKADAFAERVVAGFPPHDTITPCEAHNDEIGFHGIVVEVEKQLQQTSGRAEERHLASTQIGLECIEALPKPVDVLRIADPAGNLEALKISGERTIVADDVVKRDGALDDAVDFSLETEVAELRPILLHKETGVPARQDTGVETSEGFLENRGLNEQLDKDRTRTLAIGDSDAYAAHDFTVVGERAERSARPASDLDVPGGGRASVAVVSYQSQRPALFDQSIHTIRSIRLQRPNDYGCFPD